MRFDLGTLDSGERSLPFGLLVFLFKRKLHFCDFIFYNDFIRFRAWNFIKNYVISTKVQHSEQYAFEVQAVDTPLFHWRFL